MADAPVRPAQYRVCGDLQGLLLVLVLLRGPKGEPQAQAAAAQQEERGEEADEQKPRERVLVRRGEQIGVGGRDPSVEGVRHAEAGERAARDGPPLLALLELAVLAVQGRRDRHHDLVAVRLDVQLLQREPVKQLHAPHGARQVLLDLVEVAVLVDVHGRHGHELRQVLLDGVEPAPVPDHPVHHLHSAAAQQFGVHRVDAGVVEPQLVLVA